MKNIFFSILILLSFEILFQNCANPGTITGGPKDTIPPILIHSTPENQTLNFKGLTFTLTFDEFISADKLRQSLIITPVTEVKYKHLVKKNIVTLKFEEPFEDSTTYTLNFFDGITDITERNPVQNLIIAFSTGHYIDSLEIIGNVKDITSNKPLEKAVVGLYRFTDSLNFFLEKPTYFITTDKSGGFKLQNLKQNKYKLLAFADENRNLLFDPTESYAFISDTLELTSSITDSIELKALSVNPAELKLISGRPAGRYFEVRYSKQLNKYSINTPASEVQFATDFSGEKNESIRFYNSPGLAPEDSVQAIITAYDSLGNYTSDTLSIMFRESARKSVSFSSTLSPAKGTAIFAGTRYQLTFNKPVQLLDSSFIALKMDTLYQMEIPVAEPKFNFNNTKFSFELPALTQKFITDTITALKENLIGDSTNVDSLTLITYNFLDKYPTDKFLLEVKPAAFVSVENDTSQSITSNYSFGKLENFGTIILNLTTEETSYIVQLMQKTNVMDARKNCTNCVFTRVSAGDYWFRILLDTNGDGEWSIGNFRENMEPEPVIYFPEKTTIRANWENQIDFTF